VLGAANDFTFNIFNDTKTFQALEVKIPEKPITNLNSYHKSNFVSGILH